MLENLQGKFLIATPEMDDDYFERTVSIFANIIRKVQWE
ncbi:Uncharacterised protein [Mannheimia haemolytica]|uniref:Uncharacterized protein n=1 Tax=Mannheimia haemolytica TaxID=75985 RepID=A0A378NEF8_MANHA|nr:Uncharacterised protein [Mannheimia haemolytica]